MWRRRIERVMVECPRGFRHPEAGSVTQAAQCDVLGQGVRAGGAGGQVHGASWLVCPILSPINSYLRAIFSSFTWRVHRRRPGPGRGRGATGPGGARVGLGHAPGVGGAMWGRRGHCFVLFCPLLVSYPVL